MKLPLAYYGALILRKKCAPVETIDETIKTLVHDMTETMIEHNGIGLAAPQVHQDLQLFITAVPKEDAKGAITPGTLRVFINPKIIAVHEEKEIHSEGCLSIPKLYADVERPITVTIEATNLEGNRFTETFTELEGRCVLHENDHINGILFIDRIRGKKRKELEKPLRQIKKRYQK